jgi:LysM repeat protein
MTMKGIATLICLLMVGCASSQEPKAVLPTTHTVLHGETLAAIADRYYGKDSRAKGIRAIQRANPKIGRGPGIQGEIVLSIPKLEAEKGSEHGVGR